MPSDAYSKIVESSAMPAPQGAAMEILRRANDENATLADVTAAVEADPIIAARLLRYVNSPLAGLPRKVASVRQAVMLLGLITVKSVSLGWSLMSQRGGANCRAFDLDRMWAESLARATSARNVCYRTNSYAPDEAFTCGLLSQVGRLAFAAVSPEAYTHILEAEHESTSPELAGAEKEMFQIDHCELAAEMIRDWGLPAVFSEAIRLQDDPGPIESCSTPQTHALASSLDFGGSVACILTRSRVYRDTISRVTVKAQRLGIKPDLVHEVFDSIIEEWQEFGQVFAVPTRRVQPLAELYTQAHEARDKQHYKDGPAGSC